MAGEGVALWRKAGTALGRARQCRELVHVACGCRAGCMPVGEQERGRAPGEGLAWPRLSVRNGQGVFEPEMDTKVSEPVQGAGEGGAARHPVSCGLTLM